MVKKRTLETKGDFLRQQRTLKLMQPKQFKKIERHVTIMAINGITNISVGKKKNRSKKILAMSRISIMQIWLNMKPGWFNDFKVAY